MPAIAMPDPLERVLFVDDDAAVRRAFTDLAAPLGFAVDTAAGSAAAVARASEHTYAVIAAELHLAEEPGLALIDRLRQLQPKASYLAVTADGGEPLGDGAHGLTGVVRKPWDEEELESALHEAVEMHWHRVREPNALRLLMVEDDVVDAHLVSALLEQAAAFPHSIAHVQWLAHGMRRLKHGQYSAALVDLTLPDARGLDAVRQLQACAPELPVIAVTGVNDAALTAQALRAGAQDYLVKGEFDGHQLTHAIQFAIERKRAAQRLSYLAHHDSLTDLVNRRLFRDRLLQLVRRARRTDERLAVLFVDLDRFKTINDTLGHAIGDRLLRAVALRLRRCVRDFETVARIGGDEFALLLEDVGATADAARVAQRIADALAEPVAVDGTHIATTASVGIAMYPDDGQAPADVLRAADDAMYRAKREGRDTYRFFSPETHRVTARRAELERELAGALERGELSLEYQPQYAIAAGRLIGFEALARWDHPDLGRVPPDRFVPLLERDGSICTVGAWILHTACECAASWPNTARIAVNVSARQLEEESFVPMVLSALASSGLAPERLEIELTEGAVMRDLDAAQRALTELHSAGVRSAVDDFGTGYASLNYLRRLPLSTLKIDRTFLQELRQGRRAREVLSALAALGRAFGLEVVAEGIETPFELEIARDAGCDVAQGYLYSRPLPAARIGELPDAISRAA